MHSNFEIFSAIFTLPVCHTFPIHSHTVCFVTHGSMLVYVCFSTAECTVLSLSNDGGALGIHVVPASDNNQRSVYRCASACCYNILCTYGIMLQCTVNAYWNGIPL